MITNHLYSVSNYTASLFKDRLLPTLSNLNQRIILIMAVALGCLALCYTRFAKRQTVSSDGTIRKGIIFWGKLNGLGEKILPNGTIMRGNFEHDELHGNGEILEEDGISQGYFKHGIPSRIYIREGEVTNGQLNGPGKKILPNGTIMRGNFEHDELHGNGEILFLNGKVIKGIFATGKLQHGTITSLNGALTQIFKDGQVVDWNRPDSRLTTATALLD